MGPWSITWSMEYYKETKEKVKDLVVCNGMENGAWQKESGNKQGSQIL